MSLLWFWAPFFRRLDHSLSMFFGVSRWLERVTQPLNLV